MTNGVRKLDVFPGVWGRNGKRKERLGWPGERENLGYVLT